MIFLTNVELGYFFKLNDMYADNDNDYISVVMTAIQIYEAFVSMKYIHESINDNLIDIFCCYWISYKYHIGHDGDHIIRACEIYAFFIKIIPGDDKIYTGRYIVNKERNILNTLNYDITESNLLSILNMFY